MIKVNLITGHVLEGLKSLPAESVHCVVTSPPYWGLRDYGIEPVVWMLPDNDCPEHEWLQHEIKPKHTDDGISGSTLQGGKATQAQSQRTSIHTAFCRHCGAWRGCLGLEPTIELFVEHIVDVFREVRRVLRKDGVCFVNLGDSYSGSQGNRGSAIKEDEAWKRNGTTPQFKRPTSNVKGLKPKDLCGVPWRVALALQADGWWLRSDIIWAKPNPMPESVTDRPTRSHEYIFLLTKSAKYFWDAEAVRDGKQVYTRKAGGFKGFEATHAGNCQKGGLADKGTTTVGRNLRSVWSIATAPLPEAHFATFPPALVEKCIKAGTSEKGVCPACGAQWVRVVEKKPATMNIRVIDEKKGILQHKTPGYTATAEEITNYGPEQMGHSQTLGFRPSCECRKHGKEWPEAILDPFQPAPATVLDPFSGAGTTCLVAAKMGRCAIGIEMKPEYQAMAAKRIRKDMGMLVEVLTTAQAPGWGE